MNFIQTKRNNIFANIGILPADVGKKLFRGSGDENYGRQREEII